MATRHASERTPGLLIPPEVKCEYAGIAVGDYYTDLEQAIRVVETFPGRFEEATGYRPTVSYGVPVTPYEGVAALGGRLSFPRDHQVMLLNQGRVISSPEQVDGLTVPDPWDDERFRLHVEQLRELKERYGERAGGGIAGQEGPVTTAGLLRGQEFYVDCATDPARAHRMLEVCTEMFIRWNRASSKVSGDTPSVVGIADDYAGMLGPHMWPDYVLPYYRRIADELGPEGCRIHTELVRREHLRTLQGLNLKGINFSEDQYLAIEDVQDELPGVPFGWHIKTVSEMLQGTPDLIRCRYREIVEAGVTNVLCELTVGTPPQNIRAFLDAFEEFGGTAGPQV
jgi:uroporphyrinogen-III decarboxylase